MSQTPDATLLDVACGRGAVIDHALAAGLTAAIGVDSADAAVLGRCEYDLRGEVDACRLPFADRSFDIVTSQFGIEYAGLEPAALEAARVTRATIAFLTHASEGVVVRQAREQRDHAVWIDCELLAFETLRDAATKSEAERAVAVAALVSKLTARARDAENVSLLSGFAEIATTFVAVPRIEDIDALAIAWREHAERLADLSRAAPSAAEISALADTLGAAGFSVDRRDEVTDEGDLIGHWIIAKCEEGRGS